MSKKTKESYFYNDDEPIETNSLRTIALVIAAACVLLSFFAWISLPVVTMLIQATSSITGLSSTAEYSIPEFAISVVQLEDLVNNNIFNFDPIAMVLIIVAVILIVAIWAVPLVLAIIGLVKVFRNKVKPAYLLRSFKFMVGSSLFFIVLIYIMNFACNLSVSSVSQMLVEILADDYLGEEIASLPFISSIGEGVASLLVTDYICPTIWVWLVLILAVAGTIVLKNNRSGEVASGAVDKMQSKIKSAAASVSDLRDAKIDKNAIANEDGDKTIPNDN